MEESPSPRCRHTGWEFAGKVWTFGGFGRSPNGYLNNHGDYNAHGRYGENNQLLCYDPGNQKWTNPLCFGDVPFPRKDHATALTQDSIWLFGGIWGTSNLHRGYELFQLNMNTITWTNLEPVQPCYMRPHAFWQGTLTPATNNELVLHGSYDKSNYSFTLSDTWILDLTSHIWRPYTQRNDHIRLYHTASCNLNNGIIIIGGSKGAGSAYDPYNNIFHVMLEPKSLQKLAAQTVYTHQTELSCNFLPKKLIGLLGISDKTDSRNKSSRPSSTSSSSH